MRDKIAAQEKQIQNALFEKAMEKLNAQGRQRDPAEEVDARLAALGEVTGIPLDELKEMEAEVRADLAAKKRTTRRFRIGILLVVLAALVGGGGWHFWRHSREVLGQVSFYEEAKKHYDAGDYTAALEWFRKSAHRGDVGADYYIGLIYYKGKGVPRDYVKAAKWFQKSAAKGNDHAMYFLGRMHQKGLGIKRDLKKSLEWFRKSADQGNDDAQYFVGLIFLKGKGVAANPQEALKWFRKSAEQGEKAAWHYLGLMHRDGEGVERDLQKAREYLQKAADKGFSPSVKALQEMDRRLENQGNPAE